jgi:hypothetical protein
MATQADGLTSSVPDPLSEVLGCGLDSGDDRRQAQAYAVQAAKSAVQADADAKSAGNAAVRAESWAAGGTGTRTGEDADNAEYYAGQAKTSATAAAADRAAAETASQTAVSKAEAAAASAEAAAKSAIEAKPSDVATQSTNGLMSAADKTKLDGIAENANNYTHPSYTARASGLYKVTVDSTGHVSAAAAVDKSDITALGVPAQDTTYTHPSYTARASGLYKVTVDSTGHVSAAAAVDKSDITALGVPAQDTTYTHPSYTARASGLYKVTVDSTGHVSAATAVTKSDITALGIPIGEDHEITFSNLATGITIPNGIGKDKCYCYTVGKLGFLSITFTTGYSTSGTAIAAGKTLFYVEGVPKSIHTRYSSQNDDDGDFIAIRSSDGEQYILEATHISTGALMIKAKEAIPAGYRYKINVVFVEV